MRMRWAVLSLSQGLLKSVPTLISQRLHLVDEALISAAANKPASEALKINPAEMKLMKNGE